MFSWIRRVHTLDGKKVAQRIRTQVQNEIVNFRSSKIPSFSPSLTIIQLGNRPDSNAYVNAKLRAAEKAGIDCKVLKMDENVRQQDLVNQIEKLNNDSSVHGILVQMPLPKQINDDTITKILSPSKDVDGFGPLNVGELAKKNGKPLFIPCTPHGIIELLKEAEVDVEGKNAVVIGRSDIVGNPITYLLRNMNATVTQCHSRTRNLPEVVREADIVIAALGKSHFVKPDWIKPGAVIIDVGINAIPDATKKSGQRLIGDVDPACAEVASVMTPVPGGVGPMTVAMLMKNVVTAGKNAYENRAKINIDLHPVETKQPVPSDIEISRSVEPKPITRLAKELELSYSDFEPYGRYKGKLSLSLLDILKERKNGKYVLVAGITPTPLGEGKSTTTMGLTQAFGHLGVMSFANLRQPSMGPTFGIKGGAAGGGYSQVIPMEEFNLHITGDIHAISAANNLMAAAIDTRIFHEQTQSDKGLLKRLAPNGKLNKTLRRRWEKMGLPNVPISELTDEQIRKLVRLDFDTDTITWKRVVDCNDRHLRSITIGQNKTEKGLTRETGFDISVASECMAILALSDSLKDMRQRLGNIVVASSKSGEPITAEDIGVAGAMCAIMKDAIQPNMMQSLEGTPVLVHAGPFANISIGASSVLADKIALKLAGTDSLKTESGYVITEAGFDFTMGGERFFNIKCRSSKLTPDCIVIVATVRALKLHGGGPEVKPGSSLPVEYTEENLELVRNGVANLQKQISNARQYGRPVVIAINHFKHDTSKEHDIIREAALEAGAVDAVVSKHWEQGGKGAIDLAKAVEKACHSGGEPEGKFLYPLDAPIEEKIATIAQKMYGAADVEFSEQAKKKIDQYTAQGFGNLPICIAKTQYSLSHDPKLRGVPTGFTMPIRDVRASVGAGYLYALAAEIQTVPGLPTLPGYMNIEVEEDGTIDGMF